MLNCQRNKIHLRISQYCCGFSFIFNHTMDELAKEKTLHRDRSWVLSLFLSNLDHLGLIGRIRHERRGYKGKAKIFVINEIRKRNKIIDKGENKKCKTEKWCVCLHLDFDDSTH